MVKLKTKLEVLPAVNFLFSLFFFSFTVYKRCIFWWFSFMMYLVDRKATDIKFVAGVTARNFGCGPKYYTINTM